MLQPETGPAEPRAVQVEGRPRGVEEWQYEVFLGGEICTLAEDINEDPIVSSSSQEGTVA